MEPGLNTSNPTPYNRMLTPEVAGTLPNSDFTPGFPTFAASSPSARRNFISQPPPPVPPIPPSLFPGLNSRGPSQAHQNLDLFFTRDSPTSPYSPTNNAAFFPRPEVPNSRQSPYDHQSPTETLFTPPHVPPRPTTSYFPRVSSYGKFSYDLPRDPTSAPPAVPPRPPTARVDQGFEASVSTRAPFMMMKPVPPPPLPPKILSSPGISSIPSVPATFTASFPTDRNLPSSASSSPYTPPPPLPPKPSMLVSSSQEDPLSRSFSQGLSTSPEHSQTTSQSASPHIPVVPLQGPLATADRTSTPPSPPNDTPSSPSRPLPLLDIILPEVPHSQQPLSEPPLPDVPVEQDPPSTVPKNYQDNDDVAETSPVTLTSHLQHALTLSLEESARERETEKQADVKDDELTWALAESLAFSSKLEAAASHRSDDLFFTEPSASTAGTQLPAYTLSSNTATVNMNDSGNVKESLPVIPDNDGALSQELMDAELTRQLEIEDMARRLQEEESERLARELEEQEQTQLRREEQIRNDAEFVRRMQQEENRKIEEKRREHQRLDLEAIRLQELEEQSLKHMAGIQQQRDAEIARMMAGSQTLAQQEAERARWIQQEDFAQREAERVRRIQQEDFAQKEAERVRRNQANESRLLEEERLKCERKANESAARKKALDEEAKRVIRKQQKQKEAEKARKKTGVQAQASQQAYQNPHTGGGTGHILATPPAYIDAIKPPQPHAPPIPPAQLPSPVDIPPVIQHVSRTRAASAKAVAPRPPSRSLTRSSSFNSTAVRYHGTTARPAEQLREPSSSSATEVVAGPSSRVQTRTAVSAQDQGAEDVMQGISYGFQPPEAPFSGSQPRAVRSCPPFPEAISLFPAPSPPFHIMALSWKQLVRLLAQQESRVEVNLATIAGSKTNHHLRIVVRFLKFAHTDTWCTVIYLSLDEPVPANTPASRFKNGDTSVLPYSYTKSEELRPTGVMSQLYTIPLTPTSPFPILPITFPNIAMYLQSAMRDSRARKAQNDTLARLARIAMECYPDEVIQELEEKKQSSRVGNLLRRVVGRPERQESAGNEDVYDVITPFRVDQYVVSP